MGKMRLMCKKSVKIGDFCHFRVIFVVKKHLKIGLFELVLVKKSNLV